MSISNDVMGRAVVVGDYVMAIHGGYKALQPAKVVKITPKGSIRVKYKCPGIPEKLTLKLCTPDQVVAMNEEDQSAFKLAGKFVHLDTWEII